MPVLVPTTLSDVRDAMRRYPGAQLLAGGTDFMVEVNYGHRRPESVISLRRVAELRERRYDGDRVILGAGTTYADLGAPDIVEIAPALAEAARTVGSPQIRNAGTLGGNVGTGSPAGDTLPVLAALDASVHLLSTGGATREVRWDSFFVAPKRTAKQPDELITAVSFRRTDGPQEYLKVGTRNAMVISVAGLALVVDRSTQTVRVGLGSVGPVPLRTPAAETFLAARIDWSAAESTVTAADAQAFADLVADAARPITDHRATAEYRRHAVRVLARRAIHRCFPSTPSH